MSDQLIAFLTAAVLLTLSPGPDIIYVLVQSIANDKKAGVITALGLVSGIIVHTTLVAFGMALLIKQTPTIFYGIKILGACYLFYLAFQVFKSNSSLKFSSENVPKKKAFQLFKRGFIMNVINPKVIIFFLAFFPGFLWDPDGNLVLQFYILGALFLLQAFIIFSLVSVLAGTISSRLRNNSKAGKIFKWTQIVVFIGIGIFILV